MLSNHKMYVIIACCLIVALTTCAITASVVYYNLEMGKVYVQNGFTVETLAGYSVPQWTKAPTVSTKKR